MEDLKKKPNEDHIEDEEDQKDEPKEKSSSKLSDLLKEPENPETLEDLISQNDFVTADEDLEVNLNKPDLDFMFDDYSVSKKSEPIKKTYTKLIEPETEFQADYSQSVREIYQEALKQATTPAEKVEIEASYETNGQELKLEKVRQLIEASLFVMGSDGLNIHDIRRITDLPLFIVKVIIDQMIKQKDIDPNSGLTIKLFGNRYKMLTKKEVNQDIAKILNKKERKPLSDSTLEILSIIAYNQPCTRGVIEKIRDRDPSNALMRLQELGLIEKAGRSEAAGKPWLYVVTEKFFDLFGIKSLSDLPHVNRQQRYTEDVDLFDRSVNEEQNDQEH